MSDTATAEDESEAAEAPPEPATTTRYVPWARPGVGEEVSGGTAQELLAAAGLDWDVSLVKMGKQTEKGGFKVVPGVHAVERSDTKDTLGVVRGHYVPFPNREAFAMADELVAGRVAQRFVAGETHDGVRVHLAALLGDTMQIAGEDFQMWMLMRTSHNGGSSISAEVWPVRILCTNGLSITTPTALRRWSVAHVADVRAKVAEARRSLDLAGTYVEDFTGQVERLHAAKITPEIVLERAVEFAWPRAGERARTRLLEAVTGGLQASPTIADEDRRTGWGLLNAFTEHWEHQRRHRTAQSAAVSDLDGLGARIRDAVAAAALAG